MFSTDFKTIQLEIEQVNPVTYSKTRNFIDGSVSHLSPYISRGVISTRQVYKSLLNKGYKFYEIEKLVQELAWRDYWQQVWISKGEEINNDLKWAQPAVQNHSMPSNIINATTGIDAIDESIRSFYETGYLHNHMRMYIASLACNIGHSHWKLPAQWMYYNLLDADWASNGLSWQWVAGSNSSKQYVANQENINKYSKRYQRSTFLDVSYEQLPPDTVPSALKQISKPELVTVLPRNHAIEIDESLPTYIYNFYNLDPQWHEDTKANRILLLEPSHFSVYPVAEHTIEFILKLAENILGVQIFTGEFYELVKKNTLSKIFYKEHPLNKHYKGTEEPRDWMFKVKGYYPSFFAYWKQCSKQLPNEGS